MSTFSPFLSLELPAFGEYVNTWHVPANANFTALDALFSGNGTDEVNGTGHIHDGSDGSGPQIQHENLAFESDYVPTSTHEDLDDHVADTTIHFALSTIALAVNNGDSGGAGASAYPDAAWNNGPGGSDVIREIRFKNAAITSPSTGVIVVDVGAGAGGNTGPPQGVPTHLASTAAPVVFVDEFEGRPSTLVERNWYVNTPQYLLSSGAVYGNLLYARDGFAGISVDPTQGSLQNAYLLHRVKTQVPHSEAQRVSLFVDRFDTDDLQPGDSASVNLALASSAFFGLVPGVATPRSGLMLTLLVSNIAGTLYLTRSITVIGTYGSTVGSTIVYSLWSTTQQLSATYGIHGAHEFSLDRNHAFHYYYNNGKVDLGTMGNVGAASAFIPLLLSQHITEYPLHDVQTTPEPVAPQYGRFGFDVHWTLLSTDSRFAIAVRHFAASSTEDASTIGPIVHAGTPLREVPDVMPQDALCCGAGTLFTTLRVGDTIDVPRTSTSAAAGTDQYRVLEKFGNGDPTHTYAGFTVKRAGRYFDVEEEAQRVFCLAAGALDVETIVPARPGGKARLRLRGPRLPDLLDDPIFYPADSTAALPTPLPTWAGSYPQAIPYPVPSKPGDLGEYWYDLAFLPNIAIAGSYWPDTAAVDDRVIRSAVFVRRDDGSLEVEFEVADGVPYGSALDLLITSRTAITNTQQLAAAVLIYPPEPKWVGAKFYRLLPTTGGGGYEELTVIPENETVYAVLHGRGLPAPVAQADSTMEAQAVWAGFPFDGVADTAGKYVLIDAATGAEVLAADATITSIDVYKGHYDDAPLNTFPPVSFTPETLEGETVFMVFKMKIGTLGRAFYLRAIETVDPSTTPADMWWPEIEAATPVVTAVSISPDVDDDAVEVKTVTVTGRNFDDVEVSSSSPGLSALTLVSFTETQVVFTCVTATVTDVTVRITNQPSDNYVDVDWTVSDLNDPAITVIAPSSVAAYTYDQDFTLTCTDLSEGALVTLSNGALPIRNFVLDVGTNTITFNTDLLNASGATLTVTVTLPNGESGSNTVTVTAPATPTITNLKYYASAADYVSLTENARGREIGQTGLIKITGTGYRSGATVTSSNAGIIFGTVTVVSLTEIKIAYQIPYSATIGATSTITITDRDGTTNVTGSITIQGPTPEISDVFLMADYEGAGDAAYPAGSAAVTIVGSNFAVNGVAQVTIVNITGAATAGTLTVVDASTITIDELVIDPDTAGDTIEIELETAAGKTASWSFVVAPHVPPSFGWTLHPGAGQPALVPAVIVPSAAGHRLKFNGYNLTYTAFALTGPFAGSSSAVGTPSPTAFEITVPTIDAMVTGDPMIRVSLTVPGTATPYLYDLLPVDTTVGSATDVTSITAYEVFESSQSAIVVLDGDDLAANTVASVEFEAEFPAEMPLAVAPVTAIEPITVTITEQTATKITCRLALADNLAEQRFLVVLRAPDGSAFTITAHYLTVAAYPERPRFDYAALPTISDGTTDANDLTYDLLDAVGGEYLMVEGADNVVLVATGDPTQVRVQFDMPGTPGDEIEVRLIGHDGELLSVHRATAV